MSTGVEPAGRLWGAKWQPGSFCDRSLAWADWLAYLMLSVVLRSTNTFVIRTDLPGGRGTTKLLSKILLKRRKNCQSEFYPSEATRQACSEACLQAEACVCSNCKCCDGCRSQCACTFTIHDLDATLAELLLGQETEENNFYHPHPAFVSKFLLTGQ